METREAQAQRLAIAIVTVAATNLMASVLLSMDTLHRQGVVDFEWFFGPLRSAGLQFIWIPTGLVVMSFVGLIVYMVADRKTR